MLGLVAHPGTPSTAVRRIEAGAERASDGTLAVRYRIEGELARLRIPPPGPRQAGDRLWQHTCCEIFVAPGGGSAYREYNFSPSGAWAAYAFARYRDGAQVTVTDPNIAVICSDNGLELQAGVPAEPGRLRLALSAVIEDREGALSYWALKHPAARPDFHHPEAFALELD